MAIDESGSNAREKLVGILDEILPEPLSRGFANDQPLVDAGLDSVGLLTLVSEIETRFGLTLEEGDLSEAHFGTLAGLMALLDARLAGGRS